MAAREHWVNTLRRLFREPSPEEATLRERDVASEEAMKQAILEYTLAKRGGELASIPSAEEEALEGSWMAGPIGAETTAGAMAEAALPMPLLKYFGMPLKKAVAQALAPIGLDILGEKGAKGLTKGWQALKAKKTPARSIAEQLAINRAKGMTARPGEVQLWGQPVAGPTPHTAEDLIEMVVTPEGTFEALQKAKPKELGPAVWPMKGKVERPDVAREIAQKLFKEKTYGFKGAAEKKSMAEAQEAIEALKEGRLPKPVLSEWQERMAKTAEERAAAKPAPPELPAEPVEPTKPITTKGKVLKEYAARQRGESALAKILEEETPKAELPVPRVSGMANTPREDILEKAAAFGWAPEKLRRVDAMEDLRRIVREGITPADASITPTGHLKVMGE